MTARHEKRPSHAVQAPDQPDSFCMTASGMSKLA
jgi:hypothetical protein